MKKNTAILFGLAATLSLVSTSAFAWNDHGHMTVAEIAFARLTPTAKANAVALLKLNPQYAIWTEGIPENQQAETAFVFAATWPDAIKRDAGYQDDGTDGGDRPPLSGAGAAAAKQNIGYGDHLRHKYWHFIDTPFSPDRTQLVQPIRPNAETQIAAFRTALKTPGTSDDIKSYDLVWLEHLVGDVHQPLHATSRFISDLPEGDAGGNDVALCAKPCRSELHAFWDDVVGTGKTVTAAHNKALKISEGRSKPPAATDEKTWVSESFAIAKSDVYVDPIGLGKGPFTLTTTYKTNARKIAYNRVWLAGNRLADLLNDALK